MAVIRGKGAGAAHAGEDAAVKKGRKMTMEERLRYAQVIFFKDRECTLQCRAFQAASTKVKEREGCSALLDQCNSAKDNWNNGNLTVKAHTNRTH
jgi:hypothetical protein